MSISIETCQNEINKKSLLAGFFLFMRADRAKARSEKSESFASGHVSYKERVDRAKARSEESESFASGHVLRKEDFI